MRLVASLIFCLILTVYIGRPALSWALFDKNFNISSIIDSQNSRILDKLNRDDLKATNLADYQQEIQVRAAYVLKRAPLSDKAILHQGYVALQKGELDRAKTLFMAAQKRNSRNRDAAVNLHDIAVIEEEWLEALHQLNIFLNLEPQAFSDILPILLLHSTQPSIWPSFVNLFESDIFWAKDYFNALILQEATSPLLSLLIAEAANTKPSYSLGAHQSQRLIYNHLMTLGLHLKAYNIWRDFHSTTGGSAPVIFDPAFEGISGPLPFNWQLHQSAAGFSEFKIGGGLILSNSGAEEGAFLTQQTIGILPGSDYQMSILASGVLHKDDAPFAIHLRCSKEGKLISVQEITEIKGITNTLSKVFNIPEKDCMPQKLQVFGNRGKSPGYSEITLLNIAVEPPQTQSD